jgi:hypothetical protein
VYHLTITGDTVLTIGDDNVSAGSAEPNHVKSAISHEHHVIAGASEHNIGAVRIVELADGSKLARGKRASNSLVVPSIDSIVAAPADQQIA